MVHNTADLGLKTQVKGAKAILESIKGFSLFSMNVVTKKNNLISVNFG